MKRYTKNLMLMLAIAVAITCSPDAYALTYGSNITIYDGETGSDVTKATGQGSENNEAETGMVQSQAWDLEGFFRNGSVLSMVGGFNFKSFVPGSPEFTSGDIFISTSGLYGSPLGSSALSNGFNNVNNTYGYEYALKINWTNLSFNAYRLDPTDTTTTVWFNLNETGSATSNPWRYVSGGTLIGTGIGINGGTLTTTEAQALGLRDWNSSSASPTYTRDTHYAVSFDLSSVFADANLYGKDFYTHFTMGCGNDNLIGHDTAPVPEPGTMMLVGFGMLGLAIYGKRRMNKGE